MTSVTVTPQKLPRVAWKGVPVVTSECLASLYGTAPTNIKSNFNSNKTRFVEGKHFFLLAGQDLHDFKAVWVSHSDPVVGARARSLILWTERGAARHAKMLETDRAWEVFEALEDSYFQNRSLRTSPRDRRHIVHKEVDISIDRGLPLSIVQGNVNRRVGVRRHRDMTRDHLVVGDAYCDRLMARSETDEDRELVGLNSIALYGESRQLPLLGMGAAK